VSFTWKNVFAFGLLHIWLAEGVAKILRCAKRVFMLFTISPQHRGLNTIFCIAVKMTT